MGWRRCSANIELSRSTQSRPHGQKTGPDSCRILGSLLCQLIACSHHLMMSLSKRKWNNLFLYEIIGAFKPEGWLRNREIAARNLILEMEWLHLASSAWFWESFGTFASGPCCHAEETPRLSSPSTRFTGHRGWPPWGILLLAYLR